MKKIFFILLLILISCGMFGEELIIVTEDYPPFNYIDSQKNTAGIGTEVVQSVLKELNMTAKINVYPWARAYDMAILGQDENTNKAYVLIYSIARLPEREKLFKWVGEIAPRNFYFYSLSNRKDIKITKLADAKKYRIGTIIDDMREIYLKGQGFDTKKLDPTSTYVANIKKLLAKRIDLIIEDDIVLPILLKELPGTDISKFKKVFKIEDLSREGYYMAFSPNTPNAYVEQFKKALDKIKKNGTYDKIVKKYIK